MKTRKGQMEIMGLIVIVVMVSLGMFFIVAMRSTKPKIEVKESFETDQLAANLLSNIIRVTTDCKNLEMEKLIQDCNSEKRIKCELNEENLTSCKFVNQTMITILNNTLKEWGKNYRLKSEQLKIDIEEGCDLKQEKESSTQIISSHPNPQPVIITLDICK